MRIIIIGYSAAGKSTLAKNIGEIFNIPVLYLDKVNFISNWKERKREESIKIVEDFIKENKDYVIEGSYSKIAFDLRIKLADKIIFMDFDRATCVCQAVDRFNKYKGAVRDSMSEGCVEKFDLDFLHWILIGGRTEKRVNLFNKVVEENKDKTIILKNRNEVDEFLQKIKKNKSI